MDPLNEVKLGIDAFTEMICTICLSTSKVSPLNITAQTWLTTLGLPQLNIPFQDGVCSLCAPVLNRALKMAKKAREARDLLQSMQRDEINIKFLNKINAETISIVPLMSTHLGSNHFNYEYVYQSRETVILKDEPTFNITAVKQESPTEWLDDNIDASSDDIPIQNFKNVSEQSKKEEGSERKISDTKKKVHKKAGRPKKKMAVHAEIEKVLTPSKLSQIETDKKLREFFVIDKLNTEAQKEEMLKRKDCSNYLISDLKCDFCFRGFSNPKAYDMHMPHHTEKMGPFKCQVCQIFFMTKSLLSKHMNNRHRYKYTCQICTAVFRYRTAAKMHITWHQGKKYVCDICGQEFDHQNSCLGHKRIKHPSEDYVCDLCGFSFLNQKGVNYHRTRKHLMEDNAILPEGPLCTQCNIRFKNEEALATHHRVSPKHGKSVRNEPGRPVGVVYKSKNKKVSIDCEQCGLSLPSLRGYSAHFARLHPSATRTQFPKDARPSLCTVCGKTFKTPKNLAFHARSHSDQWTYECEICNKVFKRKDFLQKHINIHTNEKKYPCHICGKTFNHAGNRDRHISVHSTKDHKCDLCDKCFKSVKEVEVHVKYVHLKMPYPKRNRRVESKAFKRRDRDMFDG